MTNSSCDNATLKTSIMSHLPCQCSSPFLRTITSRLFQIVGSTPKPVSPSPSSTSSSLRSSLLPQLFLISNLCRSQRSTTANSRAYTLPVSRPSTRSRRRSFRRYTPQMIMSSLAHQLAVARLSALSSPCFVSGASASNLARSALSHTKIWLTSVLPNGRRSSGTCRVARRLSA